MEPKVKFKGFEGEWKKVELCSISKKVTTRNVDMQYTTTLTNSAEHGIIDQLAFFDHQVSNNDNISGYYVVENGDFVYNPRISALAPVGPINQSQIGYTGIMSPLYYVFRVDGVDTDYLSYYFKTTLWHQYLKDVGNSGARFDRLAITDSDFQEMPISLPTNREEQQSIASYFRTLDAKLQASAKKVESLKKLKSASLVALFPQNGESMPKVRFKGFEGEWKKVKLGNVCSVNRGTRITKKELNTNQSYPVYQNTNYPLGYYKNYNVEANNPYVIIGGSAGLIGFSNVPFWAADDCAYFGDNDSLDKAFLYSTLLSHIAEIKKNVRGSSVPRLDRSTLIDLEINLPSFSEQQAIASFFRSLDRKIALETARLEKLKQIKLACLDKMFV